MDATELANATSTNAEQATTRATEESTVETERAALEAHERASEAWCDLPDENGDEADKAVGHHEWMALRHAVRLASLLDTPEAWDYASNTAIEAAEVQDEPDDAEWCWHSSRESAVRAERARWLAWVRDHALGDYCLPSHLLESK